VDVHAEYRQVVSANVMCIRLRTLIGLSACMVASPAPAQDAERCLAIANRIANGIEVSAEDKQSAHEACQRALSDTSSIVQKYHLQEADFDITGTRPKN
jgi:hypothetical protein